MNVTTIVLINGLWMTALSWEHWVRHYGTKVIASLPRTGLAWKATLNNFAVIRAASPHSD